MGERPRARVNWKALLVEIIKIVIGFTAGTQVDL